MHNKLSAEAFESIRNFIKLNTGLSFSLEKQHDLEYGLRAVAHEYGVTDLPDFTDFLLSRPISTEIKLSLQRNLTIGETYFFREKPILDKFKSLLLQSAPEKRRTNKSIRIWSSGCSSGEEPYSIAITMAESLPDLASWDITIIGSDINSAALEKARTGVYRNWSFRGVEQRIIEKYFVQLGEQEFAVKNSIKSMVEFNHLNLFEDPYPSPLTKTYSLDFIFCRNVIMYFDDTGRKRVLSGFYNSLNNKGCLFLSLTELAHQSDKRFTTHKDGGVVYYQKELGAPVMPQDEDPELSVRRRSPSSQPVRILSNTGNTIQSVKVQIKTDDVYSRLEELYIHNDAEAAIALSGSLQQELLKKKILTPEDEKLALLLIRVITRAGKVNEALSMTAAFLEIAKTNAEIHYLHSTLLREIGEIEQAERALKNCLFLEPDYIAAIFAQANVQRQLNKRQESLRSFQLLAQLLSKQESNESIKSLEGMKVADLVTVSEIAITNLKKSVNAV